MTRRQTLQCAHEPFGDSFYYGPERLSERYDEQGRQDSGFANVTYKDVLDRLERDGADVSRNSFLVCAPKHNCICQTRLYPTNGM